MTDHLKEANELRSLRSKIDKATIVKALGPLDRRTADKIMAEYGRGGLDPLAVWTKRRLERLLREFEEYIRNDERRLIREQTIGGTDECQ